MEKSAGCIPRIPGIDSPSAEIPDHHDTGYTQCQRQQNVDELVKVFHAADQFLFKHGVLSFLKLSVHAPILDRFGDVHGLNSIAVGQIGDGAGHFENPMIRARREIQAHDGPS